MKSKDIQGEDNHPPYENTKGRVTGPGAAEQELLSAKQMLQSTLDSSPYVIQAFKAVRDNSSKIVDFIWVMNNKKAIEQNGDVIGQSLLKKNPGVIEAGLFQKFIAVTETGTPVDHEVYYKYEQFDAWFHQTLIKMGDGFVMNTEDITARKNNEREILQLKDEIAKQAEDKYKVLFDSMDEGYCIIQMIYNDSGKAVDWRYLQVNRAFELNNGLHDAEGKTIKEMAPDIEDKWMDIYDKVAQTGEALRFREDSKALKRVFSLYAFRIGNPWERKVAVIFADITQQYCAEAALLESEEQFRTLTQSLPQLIWTAKADGYCNFFNRQWHDYTGLSYDEAKGNGWLICIHPDYREKVYHNWQQCLATGQPVVSEFQLKDKNGIYNWFYVTGNPIRDEEGKIRKWVGALTNIEEQKEAELKLQELVNKRTVELQRSNADLQKFAYVASHDLSEPVRKIHMLADRLREEDGDKLSENGKFYVDRINSAADRMNSMIEGVLQYSELTNFEQASETIDLGELIKKIEEDLEMSIEQKSVRFQYGKLPVFEGVYTLIYQLFYNLIKNSVKFSSHDADPVIKISSETFTEDNKPFHKIILEDNGIGFADEDSERIFNSFTRLHSKDKYEGTGLGLALCRNIVERHGGTITATGEKGKGAMFTIILPAR